MNTKEKFKSLNKKSAWAYTKQKSKVNDIYNSALLFDEIPDIKNTNVEKYFAKKYKKYGISTNRHRILAISQMFGLITKGTYYDKGGPGYSNETTTPVFSELKKHKLGSSAFNKIISEQLIKIKVNAIIDTTDYRKDYHIYPFLFLFLVMWKLDKDFGINRVPVKKLWTYVLTCKSMDEVEDAAKWMNDPNAKVSPFVTQYTSDSRFLTLFFECTKMFSLEHKLLSLNHPIADKFYNEVVLKQNLTNLQSYLYNDSKYRDFLENLQGFDFDLTDNASGIVKHSHDGNHPVFKKKSDIKKVDSKDVSIVVPEKDTLETEEVIDSILDMVYEQEIKEVDGYDNKEDIEKSNNRTPVLKSGLEANKRYSTDSKLAKTVIKDAGFSCELSGKVGSNHSTFASVHGKYLEAHHLVPMKAQKDYVSIGVNLDRTENIVALCPNCHKAVHYGTKEEKIKYLRPLYDARIKGLKKAGIDISFDVLIDDYYK